MFRVRTLNAAARIRADHTAAWISLGILLSIIGAMGYANAPSFGHAAVPAIPGALILLWQARRTGFWR